MLFNAVLAAAVMAANPAVAVPSHAEEPDLRLAAFGWLRGRYLGPGPERTEWERLVRSAESLRRLRTAEAQQVVRKKGFNLVYRGDGCFGDELCERVMRAEGVAPRFDTWGAFEGALKEAMPLVRGYLAAVRQGENQMKLLAGSTATDKELKARFAKDQMLRASLSNNDLALTPAGQAVFRLVIGLHLSRTDRDNAEWLRRLLATSGWPTSPEVTPEGADAAWFLLVHARHDPGFRLDAVDVLQEAAQLGKMSRAGVATKIDHILSETTGLQRYGTKGNCVAGRFVLVPSEQPIAMPRIRHEAGLPTLDEQSEIMGRACSS